RTANQEARRALAGGRGEQVGTAGTPNGIIERDSSTTRRAESRLSKGIFCDTKIWPRIFQKTNAPRAGALQRFLGTTFGCSTLSTPTGKGCGASIRGCQGVTCTNHFRRQADAKSICFNPVHLH